MPKGTIYNPQQGCPAAQQKGGFGRAGAGVDAKALCRQDQGTDTGITDGGGRWENKSIQK